MINYIEKGIQLHEAIKKAGYDLFKLDNLWISSNDIEVQKIIDKFDPSSASNFDAKRLVKEASVGKRYRETLSTNH